MNENCENEKTEKELYEDNIKGFVSETATYLNKCNEYMLSIDFASARAIIKLADNAIKSLKEVKKLANKIIKEENKQGVV